MRIAYRQNQQDALRRLAAQRLLYRRAKIASGIGVALVLLVAVLGFVAMALDDPALSRVVPLATLVLWFVDQHLLKRREIALVHEAAAIQEDFDCYVLDLPWPEQKGIQRPTGDRVRQLALAGKGDAFAPNKLKDWYSPSAIPEDSLLGALHCQRMSAWWDSTLRVQWKTLLKGMIWILLLASAVVAVLRDVSVASLVAMGASNVRVFAWVVGEIDKQKWAIVRAKGAHSFLSTFSPEVRPSECDLRRVQDEILELRRSSPLIPEWFYCWRREGQQAEAAAAQV